MIEQPEHNDFVNADYMLHHKDEQRGPFRGKVATRAAAEGWQTALGGNAMVEVEYCLTKQCFAYLAPGGVWSGGNLRCPDGEGEDSWAEDDQ